MTEEAMHTEDFEQDLWDLFEKLQNESSALSKILTSLKTDKHCAAGSQGRQSNINNNQTLEDIV